MMIDSKTARKLIMRLSGLPGYPRTPEGLSEMVAALAECAMSVEMADAVVQCFSQHGDQCPFPVDIRRQCVSVKAERDELRSHCAKCNGTGFVVSWKLKTVTRQGNKAITKWEELREDQYHAFAATVKLDSQTQAAYECAEPCECRKYSSGEAA